MGHVLVTSKIYAIVPLSACIVTSQWHGFVLGISKKNHKHPQTQTLSIYSYFMHFCALFQILLASHIIHIIQIPTQLELNGGDVVKYV